MREGKNDMSKFYKIAFLVLAFVVFSLPVLAQSVTADFTYNQTCKDFNFFDNSSPVGGTIVQWDWDFGDGGTSTDQNPGYSYLLPDDYLVTLTVTLDDLTTTDQTFQTVSINPIADFGYIQTCDNFEFLDQSTTSTGNITGWLWDFGDSNTSTDQNPIYTYTVEGEYTVLLTVSHDSGCDDTVSQVVSFYYPTAAFSYINICDDFMFQNQSSVANGELTYLWDFGDTFTSTSANPNHTFPNPGDYTVSLTVIHASGCQDYIEQLISFQKPIAQFSHDIACLGIETCFYDESIANSDSIMAWIWDFGDGISSSLENPCHTYSSTGQYVVTLTVVNSDLCASDPVTDTLYVDYPPEAQFFANPVCFHDSTSFINLTDTHEIQIAYWQWDFGDPGSGVNNSSDLFEPKHLFTLEGSYDVTLFVENVNGCTSELIQKVVVDSLPEAGFIMTDTVAVGIEFEITDMSIPHGYPILSWFWDFGDGATALNPNPIIHTYTAPGNYEVCLIISDFNGCTDTLCSSIVVTALPYVDFSYNSDATYFANFYDETTPDTTLINWFWDFGDLMVTTDTISGTPNPTYQYPSEGFYYVNLKVWDSYGGICDTTKPIYIGNTIIAGFYYEDICFGDTLRFKDESYSPVAADITSWYWNFGDGSDTLYFEHTDSLVHYYNASGTYTVYLATNGSLEGIPVTDTIFQEVTVYAAPVAMIDSSNLIVCLGTPINFTDSSYTIDGDTIVNWFWDFGDGWTSNLQNKEHEYDSIGDYMVTLNVSTTHYCESVDTVLAKVTTAPNISFNIENIHACVNSPTYFIPTDSDVEITDWFWHFGDHTNPNHDTSTSALPSYTYSTIANYNVTMVASSWDCAKSVTKTFLVYPIPFSDFSYIQDYGDVQGRTLFNNQSIYATSYLWDFGNGQTSTVADPIEIYEKDSTYLITLISTNQYNCSDTSRYELLVFFKGLYFPTAFSPDNPNYEISRFEPKGVNLDKYLIQVFDLRGNLMWESDKVDENGSPVESWDGYYNGFLMPNGVYVWQANATFRDGTIWKGSTLQSDNPQTYGTVTLVR